MSGAGSRGPADSLGLSQPAISHQLKALSTAVGIPVLEMIGRRVQLTQAGQVLYDHAKRILDEFEAAGSALDQLRGLRRGSLRLAGDTTVGIYVLPDLLGAFRHEHPGVEVRLGVDNRQGLYNRLLANEPTSWSADDPGTTRRSRLSPGRSWPMRSSRSHRHATAWPVDRG